MRKMNMEGPLSEEDIAWLRQAGSVMTEEQIARHQAQFEAKVPDAEVPGDEVTRSALDPSARTAEYVPGEGAPTQIDPTQADSSDDAEIEDIDGDDYETWKVAELETEVTNRNLMDDTTRVEVIGTGKNGAVTKTDLVKGLRLWDVDNPGALDQE